MTHWSLPAHLPLAAAASSSPCFAYAQRELARLLGRLGTTVASRPAAGAGWHLRLGDAPPALPELIGLTGDAYAIAIAPGGAALAAPSAKGVLNAVYDLAQQLGYAFLQPGDEGEWAPETPAALPCGLVRRLPRFPHRGIFGGFTTQPHTPEQWLRFHAKLRFNAVSAAADLAPLAEELGLRLEIGGHDMAAMLPRELHATRPELFRMFQPEDFNGQRLADSNFCPTHPETRRLVTTNFARRVGELPATLYAYHAWADDLPAGGWCMCARCRSFTASDQAMLAMRMQADAIRQAGCPMRVPTIAYHDTMYPPRNIPPAPECFLLYAPRERCYAHALDDARCPRNRWYLRALEEWQATCARNPDAHTFEYYFDQILFRGLHPWLPAVILGDLAVYAAAGIATNLSLQTGGPLLAPDHNMLLFAAAQWDESLTPAGANRLLARTYAPRASAPWQRYFTRRADAYRRAMRLCHYPTDVYFDYRWLPESALPFAREMVDTYRQAADLLTSAADDLAAAVRPAWPARLRDLAAREAARSRFEAADLRFMAAHQHAVNRLADFHADDARPTLADAVAALREALAAGEQAYAAASAAGVPPSAYYYAYNQHWARKELAAKLALYAPLIP